MVGLYHRHPDLHHLDSFLAILPRLPNERLVLDTRRAGKGRRPYQGQPSRRGKQNVQEGTVSPLLRPYVLPDGLANVV